MRRFAESVRFYRGPAARSGGLPCAAALMALCAALAGCGAAGQSGGPAFAPASPASAAPVSSAAPAVSGVHGAAGAVPALQLGGAWFSFRAQLGAQVVELPLAPGLRAALGWELGGAGTAKLEPGQSADVLCETPGGTALLRLANMGEHSLSLNECPVVGLLHRPQKGAEAGAAQAETSSGGTTASSLPAGASASGVPADILLPGGVGPGTAETRVRALYGEPNPGGGETGLVYSAGGGASLELRLVNGAVAAFTLQRLSAPPAPPAKESLPQKARAYAAPSALGEELWSYNILYGGKLYTLPAPAAAFLENGWVLCDAGTVPPGGFCMGVGLRLGNQILRTTLYNYGDTAQPLEGCFVVMAESSNSARIPLALPGGVNEGLSYSEALALLGPPDETEEDMNSHTLTYAGPDGKLVLRFTPGENTEATPPFDLELWHLVL